MSPRKILIVDDSPVLRSLIRRALTMAGVDTAGIREAGNGREALDEVERDRPDLILLDLNMPVMDGFAFVDEVSRRHALADMRVFVVSTEGNDERLEGLREKGIAGYLRKPFEPEDLRKVLEDPANEQRSKR